MYYDNPFFEPENDWVTVWVGSLDVNELEDYIGEPGGVADDEPNSKFSKDLGRWYDHDFIWAEAAKKEQVIKGLFEENGIDDDDLISEVEVRSQSSNVKCFLILWNAKKIAIDSRVFADGKITCLGSWQHESPLVD